MQCELPKRCKGVCVRGVCMPVFRNRAEWDRYQKVLDPQKGWQVCSAVQSLLLLGTQEGGQGLPSHLGWIRPLKLSSGRLPGLICLSVVGEMPEVSPTRHQPGLSQEECPKVSVTG